MLVIISDLHLTDGTSGETIDAAPFRVFRERLRDTAYDASWRSNGKYEPIKELDLVLLGDILDVIRSTKWCSAPATVRPWGNVEDPRVQEKIAEITDAILEHNKQFLTVLKSLNDGKTITIPPATPEGGVQRVSRDPAAAERVPVWVRIHYVAGNHDWFYHLPGSAYDATRARIIEALGLANEPGIPFPHDPAESPELTRVCREHQVFARHGDIFDSLNFEGNRNASSFGDAMVIELLNRFPDAVRTEMGHELSQECRDGLKELDNVRPLEIIPVWINGLLRRTCTEEQAARIKRIWNQIAVDFLRLEFVQPRTPFFLKWGLALSRDFSLASLSRLVLRFKAWLLKTERFFPNAFGEAAFRDLSARFIVYGHTHHHEIVPLRSLSTARGIVDQVYINSGTWRAVHELAQFRPQQEDFVGYDVMTYLAFFKEDERNNRKFETWSGSLDSTE